MSDGLFKVLNFPGDRRGDLTPGQMVEAPSGTGKVTVWQDWAGRPYEVIDVDYDSEIGMSAVHLQYARPETLRAYAADRQAPA